MRDQRIEPPAERQTRVPANELFESAPAELIPVGTVRLREAVGEYVEGPLIELELVSRELRIGRDSERHRLRRQGDEAPILAVQQRRLVSGVCEAGETYFTHRFGVIELYDDTLATLAALAGRYRVGLTSNGNNYPARFGLSDTFDFVVFSEECGFAKPDPRIYREALRRGGSAPGEAVHVGDSLINDVQGAQAAGIYAVWLNRRGIANDTTIQPDATISNLHQLPDLIG